VKHDQLTVPYSAEDLAELRRLKPTRFAQARGVQVNEVACRLLATLDAPRSGYLPTIELRDGSEAVLVEDLMGPDPEPLERCCNLAGCKCRYARSQRGAGHDHARAGCAP
jgi:hypothetical protein